MSLPVNKKSRGKAGTKAAPAKLGIHSATASHATTKPQNHGVAIRQKVI